MTEPLLSRNTAQQLGSAANAISNDPRFSFFHKLREERLSNLRSLGDFFDKDRIKFTTSFHTISQRWNITNWFLLFSVMFIVGGFYLISRLDGPLTIGGTALSPSSLYASYAAASIILLLFSGATGVIFWIIGAAALIVLGHAALLEPGLEGDFGADGQV
ncbi:hypothetical protein DFQ28_010775 [Apophysomyces sp. BC1034]|nr:hypothetical protein DFQ29_009320 [Apophysomyces sp. BC1021]KAG0184648.1 hypothetical protein DFQ28_010775 [Apophysomyces sp. BC1034]